MVHTSQSFRENSISTRKVLGVVSGTQSVLNKCDFTSSFCKSQAEEATLASRFLSLSYH